MTYLWLDKLNTTHSLSFTQRTHVTIFRHFTTENIRLGCITMNHFTPGIFVNSYLSSVYQQSCTVITKK